MIKTTINISDKTLEKIESGAAKLNLSKTDFIKLLMRNIHLDNKQDNKYLKFFSIVKYQERDSDIEWFCMHITLTPSEYEHFIDMRNMFKKSVSHLIAFAVEKYLEIILKKQNKIKLVDNNPPIYFPVYLFYIDFVYGVKSYIISSELPMKYP